MNKGFNTTIGTSTGNNFKQTYKHKAAVMTKTCVQRNGHISQKKNTFSLINRFPDSTLRPPVFPALGTRIVSPDSTPKNS